MGGLGCDNMTVVLVCFLNENSYEHLAERCSTIPKTTLTDNQESITTPMNGSTDPSIRDVLGELSEPSSTGSDSSDNEVEAAVAPAPAADNAENNS